MMASCRKNELEVGCDTSSSLAGKAEGALEVVKDREETCTALTERPPNHVIDCKLVDCDAVPTWGEGKIATPPQILSCVVQRFACLIVDARS